MDFCLLSKLHPCTPASLDCITSCRYTKIDRYKGLCSYYIWGLKPPNPSPLIIIHLTTPPKVALPSSLITYKKLPSEGYIILEWPFIVDFRAEYVLYFQFEVFLHYIYCHPKKVPPLIIFYGLI